MKILISLLLLLSLSAQAQNEGIDKELEESKVTEEVFDVTQDRFPKTEPQFVKPPAPKGGGKVRVPHPLAEKGLMQITSDGAYHYKTKQRPKSQAGSLKFLSMSPPKITSESGAGTYESFYGKDNLTGLTFNYEWQPFSRFGRLGLDLGFGVATVRASGVFKSTGLRAREVYTLYVVPLSAFAVYRFEYARKQWVVPFINGGATYFGLSESRDDGKPPKFFGAASVGGGGGVHLSLSNLNSRLSFSLAEEYGISDLWLTAEVRAMKGLDKNTDFTTNMIHVGFTADY